MKPKKGQELIEEIKDDLEKQQPEHMAKKYWLGYTQALYDLEYIDSETFRTILMFVAR